jgi:nucleotide-binding universal stress UspA family protein
MFKHILIPTDGSELSVKAIKAGVTLAKTLGAKVTGVHAYPSVFAIYYGELAWTDDRLQTDLREAARKEGEKYLEQIQAAAKAANVPCEIALVEKDNPWQAIVETAERRGCDLIVMAAHGRRGLSAVVLGSETNKVLTHSTIPVLVYR